MGRRRGSHPLATAKRENGSMSSSKTLASATIALAVLIPATTASASPAKPKPPGIGATIVIPAMPGAYGSYSVTLLQVYWNLSYIVEPVGAHPFVARVRVSDTGSTSVHESPEQDANALLLGHDYPTWAVAVGAKGTVWQLLANELSNSASGPDSYWSGMFTALPGCHQNGGTSNCTGTCPAPTVLIDNPSIYTYGDINLIPGSAAETCVTFSLPVKVDRTTMKFCWTPQAQYQLQQPTYCWQLDNDKLGAV